LSDTPQPVEIYCKPRRKACQPCHYMIYGKRPLGCLRAIVMPWLSSQKRTLAGKTVEGGCCPEFDVRVFGVDCIRRADRQCNIQSLMGRLQRRATTPADNLLRGLESNAGRVLL
jgi:hypothetical protein